MSADAGFGRRCLRHAPPPMGWTTPKYFLQDPKDREEERVEEDTVEEEGGDWGGLLQAKFTED